MTQPTKVVHVVQNLDQINFGIWNAAFFGSSLLEKKYEVKSCALICLGASNPPPKVSIPFLYIENLDIESVHKRLQELSFITDGSIVVSHGCWLMPTKVAHALKKLGFKWMYVPHGMLEPWSIRQNWFKKNLYWNLVEKRLSRNADVVRAVSRSEQINLEKKLNRKICLIENGVQLINNRATVGSPIVFVFMARLHFKKGITPLVKAWYNVMKDANDFQLVIAGPDEGELVLIKPYLGGNITYLGPVYGEEKINLLVKAHYYILPSASEGFPTSVLEAMSLGLIPIISHGCNFPEVFSHKLGYEIGVTEESISVTLQDLRNLTWDVKKSTLNQEFISTNYSEEKIVMDLFIAYKKILET